MDNKQIKIIWQELQGYLSQIPSPKDPYETMNSEPIGSQINSLIDELNVASNKNYDKFKITIGPMDNYIELIAIRTKLGGLIDNLHADYFEFEPRPFSGKTVSNIPQTVISQNQTQNQSVDINLLIDITSKIVTQLNNPEISDKEKGFLEKVKDSLGTVKDAIGLLSLITNVGISFGITIEAIKKLFSL